MIHPPPFAAVPMISPLAAFHVASPTVVQPFRFEPLKVQSGLKSPTGPGLLEAVVLRPFWAVATATIATSEHRTKTEIECFLITRLKSARSAVFHNKCSRGPEGAAAEEKPAPAIFRCR